MGGSGNTSSKTEKLATVQISTSCFGHCKTLAYGTTRISANLIDFDDFKAHSHTEGGKGGGGITTYDYTASTIQALCEGGSSGIVGVNRVWNNTDCYNLSYYGLSLLKGTRPQFPWATWTSKHPQKALGYSGTALVCCANMDLGSSGTVPNLNYEVIALLATEQDPSYPAAYDSKPSAVVVDFLSNPIYGSGWQSSRIADLVTGSSSYQTYCTACGFVISPPFTEQQTAAQCLADIMTATNSETVWSAGQNGMVLKVVPYGDTPVTGNGASYIPNTSPEYDLGFDDFLGAVGKDGKPTGTDPITITRSSVQDIKNDVPVEYYDRLDSYNTSIVDNPDVADVSLNGFKQDSSVTLHMITRSAHALQISRILAQRNVYVRNTYTFKVGWKYMLLEPMDLVTLTDPITGIDHKIVRIISVEMPEETSEEDGVTVTAEEWPFGIGSTTIFATQIPTGANPNTDPGYVNVPVIFQSPALYSGGQKQLVIATSGGANWGGCQVWVSEDEATYNLAGNIMQGARHGTLTAALPAGSTSDTTDTLAVQLADISKQFSSISPSMLVDLDTLCWVDGEMLAYQTATLTGAGSYNLTTLNRGAYGTSISAHSSGAPFARVDDTCLTIDIPSTRTGSLFFKFQSYNLLGSALQDLSVLPVYVFSFQSGVMLGAAITNLCTVFRDSRLWLHWDAINLSGVSYEVRVGASWSTASVSGVVSNNEILISGDGTYWVAARYETSAGTPSDVVVAGTALVANVVATWDEFATGWVGSVSGYAGRSASGGLELGGSVGLDTSTNIDNVPNVDFFGGVAGADFYEVPASHVVDIGAAQACGISANLQTALGSLTMIFDQIPNVDLVPNVDGGSAGLAAATVMIAIAQNDGNFAAWQVLSPGVYVGRKFKAGLALSSSDSTVYPLVTGFSWTIDMPDKVQKFTNQTVFTSGIAFTFSPAFQVQPNVQVTIHNALAGDIWVRDSISMSGVSGHISNGGVNVSRIIDLVAQGY
jgi:hypothetical protein